MAEEEILRKLLVVTTRTETKLDGHIAQGRIDHDALVERVIALEARPNPEGWVTALEEMRRSFFHRHATPLVAAGTALSGLMATLAFIATRHF